MQLDNDDKDPHFTPAPEPQPETAKARGTAIIRAAFDQLFCGANYSTNDTGDYTDYTVQVAWYAFLAGCTFGAQHQEIPKP